MNEWPSHLGRVVLETVDSTNAEALRRAGRGGDCWIMARAQTAGTGRRGKVWETAQGNLAASLVLHSDDLLPALAQRSFVAALALYETLVGYGAKDVTLKWPNDVLVQGRKIAGILLVSAPGAVVVGIGVNLVSAPDTADLRSAAVAPIALAEVAEQISPDDFLIRLAVEFDRFERQMRSQGFAPVRSGWLERAARIGKPIKARLPDRTLSGIFETIDSTGALVLRTDNGKVTLPAAEVFF